MGLDIGWIGCWLFLLDTIFHKLQCQKNFGMFVFLFYFHQYARCIFEKSYFDNERPTLFAEKDKSEPRNGDKPFLSMKEQKYSCLKQ
jgi:hypothetical protein